MRRILAGLIIGVLVLAGCSAPADDNTKTANNTVSNEVNDTSIYFDRVAGEDKYTNYFETWTIDDYSTGVGQKSLYGMNESETAQVYSNEKNIQYIYSPSNGHTYKVDTAKVSADIEIDRVEVIAIDRNILYILDTRESSLQTAFTVNTLKGDNPIVVISGATAVDATLVMGTNFYFSPVISDENYVYEFSEDGVLTNYGVVTYRRPTEFTPGVQINFVAVNNKMYIQTWERTLFEISNDKLTKLDFTLSDNGWVVSNIVTDGTNMYAIRAISNERHYTDTTTPHFKRIYLIVWDNDFNVVAEYDMPDNYGTTETEYGGYPEYNLLYRSNIIRITEGFSGNYHDGNMKLKYDSKFFNHTFNTGKNEIKNGSQYETNEYGKIIQ